METVSVNLFKTVDVGISSYASLNTTLADLYSKIALLSLTPIGTIIANISTANSLTMGN